MSSSTKSYRIPTEDNLHHDRQFREGYFSGDYDSDDSFNSIPIYRMHAVSSFYMKQSSYQLVGTQFRKCFQDSAVNLGRIFLYFSANLPFCFATNICKRMHLKIKSNSSLLAREHIKQNHRKCLYEKQFPALGLQGSNPDVLMDQCNSLEYKQEPRWVCSMQRPFAGPEVKSREFPPLGDSRDQGSLTLLGTRGGKSAYLVPCH